ATVQGDVIRLHQLVMNVCTNAVQAMPEGGLLEIALDVIELSERMVQRHHTIEPGAYVRLKVTDTGQGIDEATLDRVFDPFFTTKDLGLGTGLGLSLVHSIVSDHGGAIEVSSTPGQGSSFTVYLPRSLETASASGMERVPIPKGRGQTVLLVDNDEALVLLGEEMIAPGLAHERLRRAGACPQGAARGGPGSQVLLLFVKRHLDYPISNGFLLGLQTSDGKQDRG
ncbi:MAG: ATP-binding protein, partial [Acidimicrobiia bacterium]